MYYIVSEIFVDGRFLGACFYRYFQQIISGVANESLIPYNLIKRGPKTQNLSYCNTECLPKLNLKNTRYNLHFRAIDFSQHKYIQ